MKVVGCQPYAPAAFTSRVILVPILEAELTPGHMEMSDATGKIPGDTRNRSRDFRLVALCLNDYATPGPILQVPY
jgi:hypothetical protein